MRVHVFTAVVMAVSCADSRATLDGAGEDGVVQRGVASFSQTGGSLLTFLTLGNFPNDPRPAVWDSDVKGMVAWYHLDPSSVRPRLAAMKANGQRRVGVVVWYSEPDGSGAQARSHYSIPQADFTLYPQQRQNLIAFLRDVDAVGFDEVQVRFAPQGGAEFQCYENPACYSNPGSFDAPHLGEAIDFNWTVVRSTIDAVEAAGLATPRLYDLALEYTGHPFMALQPNWAAYVHGMWSRYVAQLQPRGINAIISTNGVDDDGIEATFKLFDAVGWPRTLGCDIYDGVYGALGTLSAALARHGHADLPVYLQETYENDAVVADQAATAARDFGLSLQHIMQWPAKRGVDAPQADLTPYDQYANLAHRALPVPRPSLGSIQASPSTCTVGTSGACASTLSWTTSGVSSAVVKVEDKTFAGGTSGSSTAPWITKTYVRFELWGDGAFIGAAIVNGVAAGATTAPSAKGTLSASGCTIPAGQSLCTSTVTWSTVAGVSDVQVRIGSQLFAAGASGSQQAPWISTSPATFELWGDGARIATATVTGTASSSAPPPPPSSAGLLTADPPSCLIASGQSLCTATIAWNVPGATECRVVVNGQLFSLSGPSGSQAAPWISTSAASFELWADGAKVDSLTVTGHY